MKPAEPQPSGTRLRWRRALHLIGSLGLLAGLLFCFRSPILAGTARAWMVNSTPVKSDAIVVLGGDPNSRAFEAAKLYHAGWAPKILVMSPKLRATDSLGITISQADLTRRILLSNAVPEAAIQIRGTELTSTFSEAGIAQAWLRETGGDSLLIPTGPFHSRRVRWVFRRTLGPTTRLTVTSIHPEMCDQWWKQEESLIDFANEIMKFAYYLAKY